MYLDELQPGRVNSHKHIIALFGGDSLKGLHDAKSHVQELAQEKMNVTPKYKLMVRTALTTKTFVMGIYFGEHLVGKGEGSSKQDAEQAAARDALHKQGIKSVNRFE